MKASTKLSLAPKSLYNKEIEVPEIVIHTKEKFSILDKVLISAFNKERLVELYQCILYSLPINHQ